MWIAQAFVFWKGMEAIRKFIDFCGPAVYVVMFLLAGYLVYAAGPSSRSCSPRSPWWSVLLLRADAQLRRLHPLRAQLRGREEGQLPRLPVNFLVFALLVVVTAAATQPVFGELITDPVETVARLDSTFAVVLRMELPSPPSGRCCRLTGSHVEFDTSPVSQDQSWTGVALGVRARRRVATRCRVRVGRRRRRRR